VTGWLYWLVVYPTVIGLIALAAWLGEYRGDRNYRRHYVVDQCSGGHRRSHDVASVLRDFAEERPEDSRGPRLDQ
jgi:hypothetical protein